METQGQVKITTSSDCNQNRHYNVSMILDRIFGYGALEDRLQDKDREIARLLIDIADLRDRLFIKYSLPVSGAAVTANKAESVQGWMPKQARLQELMNQRQPLTAPALSDEELQMLRDASQ